MRSLEASQQYWRELWREQSISAPQSSLYPELGYKAPGLEEAGKDARFWLVQHGLRAVAHAAKHRDDASSDIEWERRDPRGLILMVSALLESDPS